MRRWSRSVSNIPSRQQLSAVFRDPDQLRAFEALFRQAQEYTPTDIAGLQTQIDAINIDVTGIDARFDTVDSSIADILADITTLGSQIGNLEAALTSLTVRVVAIEGVMPWSRFVIGHWTYVTGTGGPSAGQMQDDTDTLWLANADHDGYLRSGAIAALVTGATISLQDVSGSAPWVFSVSSAPINHTGHWEIPVTEMSGTRPSKSAQVVEVTLENQQ